MPLTAYLAGRNRDQPDADRFEPVKPVEDLRFSARKYRGMEVRRDCALLSGAPALDNSTVDANDAPRARSSIRKEGTHNGRGQPGVEGLDLAIGPDILEKRTNLSPADYPTVFDLSDQLSHDHRAIWG